MMSSWSLKAQSKVHGRTPLDQQALDRGLRKAKCYILQILFQFVCSLYSDLSEVIPCCFGNTWAHTSPHAFQPLIYFSNIYLWSKFLLLSMLVFGFPESQWRALFWRCANWSSLLLDSMNSITSSGQNRLCLHMLLSTAGQDNFDCPL